MPSTDQSIDPARYPAFLITKDGDMLSACELGALVAEIDDEITAIQEAPEAIFVMRGTQARVLDLWNDLTSLREEVLKVMIWRLFNA